MIPVTFLALILAQVDPYPRVPGDRPCADYPSVTVGGTPVDTVGLDLNVGYAHFAAGGEAVVRVTAREEIESYDLSPHHLGIRATAKGRTLSFTLSKPCKLHLRVNGLQRFFIFAEERESGAPKPGDPGVFRLEDFGVASSADSVQTAKIQKAIDDVASKKGILRVGPGIYRTGELRLKSGLSLYLAPGSVLRGTGLIKHHPVEGKFVGGQMIYLRDCEGVRIFGRGVIDANGRAMREATAGASRGKLKLLRSLRARRCTVEDVILRDSGSWGIHLVESDRLTLSGFKLISLTEKDVPDVPFDLNTDGVDADNCSHLLVENGFISCHDDALCVKNFSGAVRDIEDMVFRKNVVWTVKSALKIGEEMQAGFKVAGVRFEGNDVVHADRGISVRNYWGGEIVDPQWVGNRFETIGGDIKRMHLEIKIQNERGKGIVRNILIKDNVFETPSPELSDIRGLDADHAILGLTLENLVVAGRRVTRREEARLKVKRFVERLVIR